MELVKENKPAKLLNSIKVLIADDDIPTRMLLRAAVSQWGYEIVEAKDGEQAWHLLQGAKAPDLVILDWIMPKIDGPTLCEKIKKELPHIPYIILLTQVTGTTNITKGLEAGADEFLSKPFNMAELRSRLSVGARIVNYKNELTQLKKQIASFGLEAHKITHLLEELINEISDLYKLPNSDEIAEDHAKKIKVLQNNIQQLKEILQTMNLIPK